MNGGKPLVECLQSGFRLTTRISIISNLKKLLMELTNSENEMFQRFAAMGMMAAPLTMLSCNANLDINFDDFDEVREHPMAS